jgi:hypothetical protein
MLRIIHGWRGALVPAGFVLSFLVLATGCSSSGTVSGKVTYQTRPLTGGTVLFTSPQGKGTRRAEIGEDGSYTIANMPTGPVKIAVDTRSAQEPPPATEGQPNMKLPPGDLPPEAARSGIYGNSRKKKPAERIPEEYADPDKSGLDYTVTSGAQTKNIELK